MPMDEASNPDFSSAHLRHDSTFQQQVERLHQISVSGRWLVVAALWLTVAPLSLWNLRFEISLWLDYFTWTAVRYGLAYHRLAAIGLGLCLGMTLAVLLWQSRNLIWGRSQQEQRRLELQVLQIRRQGPSHPLWQWVCGKQ